MSSMFSQTNKIPSLSPRCRYDVFLSFRGHDTRDNFTYYLYRAFLAKRIHTFRDDDEIGRGKQVMTELMEAIKESKYSVIIISENYASSSWCLNELVRILECSKTLGHTVYAVFYHVNPSNVRKQTGEFGKGFSKAVSKDRKSARRWKEALEEIAGLKGWVYPSPGYGAELLFIDALVEDVFGKLKVAYLNPLEGLVGMKSRMDKVIKLLDLGSDEARMVGICGMGGIGKTTIAKAVYKSISGQFEGCCFIENVREVANRSGLKSLQEQLISNTLMGKNFELENVMSGIDIIRDRACHKKVLIVLDDVDGSIELENLIGKLDWFSNGSRIIITTQDLHMLSLLGVKDLYKVQELNKYESRELFESKAFIENRVITVELRRLIGCAIQYAQGSPLALKVLGSSLLNLAIPEWESALNRLKDSPGDKVQQVLRISYDGLHREEQEIFLDIYCFFRGKDKDEVISFLGTCGFNPDISIRVLVEKSLLTISENNVVGMHDLVQKMGWTVVKGESTDEPGKHSRLWYHGDIKHVLTENTGTEKLEGIYDNDSVLGAEDLKLVPNAFAKMTNLRLLRIHSTSSCIYLPNMLRYLHWHGYPSKCLPAAFKPEHLAELHLTHSRIKQIWKGKMALPKLTVLDLRHSMCITKSPDFTGFPNLEKLCLEGCTGLRDLHPSIKKLEKLTIMILKGCRSLETVPYGIGSQRLKTLIFSGCLKLRTILERFEDLKQLLELHLDGTEITEVPQLIGNASNLSYLDLSRCKELKRITSNIGQLKKLKELFLVDCLSLDELPEEVGFIESLEILKVEYSGIRQLPSSIVLLKNLQFLSLRRCKGFPSNCTTLEFPSLSGINCLTSLVLSGCNLKSIPESVFCCFSLKELRLNRNNFQNLPASIKGLGKLEVLEVEECKNLLELPELPPNLRHLIASGCESLKTICSLSLFKHARKLYFSNCSKLVDNEEIKTLLKKKFLFNQIEVNNHVGRVYVCPGSKIPKWFTYQNDSALLKIQVPPHDSCPSSLLGFALSAIVSSNKHCIINVQIRFRDKILTACLGFPCHGYSNDVSILYIPIDWSSVDMCPHGGMDFEVCFSTTDYQSPGSESIKNEIGEPTPVVKSCGARLIYKDDLRSFGNNDKATRVASHKSKIIYSHLIFFVCLFIFSIYISRYIRHIRKVSYNYVSSTFPREF